MTTEIKARTFQRVATAAEWASANPILGNGEIGVDVTNNQFRVGDGVKRWLELPPVGVTVGQIEGIINAYLAAHPPAGGSGGSGGSGGGVTLTPHPTINGAAILTFGGDSGSTTPSGVAPTVTVNPNSTSVASGSTVTLVASASGTPSPAVQWQSRSSSAGTWASVNGATNGSYTTPTLTYSDNGRQYRAVFTNSAGQAISSVAIITVAPGPAPVITVQPDPSSILYAQAGQPTITASYQSKATTSQGPLTFQWQWQREDYDTPASYPWTDIAGATGTIASGGTAAFSRQVTEANGFVFTPPSGYLFRCRFTDAAGQSTLSASSAILYTYV